MRVRWISGTRVIWKNGPAGKEQSKSNGQPNLTQPMSAFSSDNNGNGTDDIQWWVEGTYTSDQLRDIELAYEYQPPGTSTWRSMERPSGRSARTKMNQSPPMVNSRSAS